MGTWEDNLVPLTKRVSWEETYCSFQRSQVVFRETSFDTQIISFKESYRERESTHYSLFAVSFHPHRFLTKISPFFFEKEQTRLFRTEWLIMFSFLSLNFLYIFFQRDSCQKSRVSLTKETEKEWITNKRRQGNHCSILFIIIYTSSSGSSITWVTLSLMIRERIQTNIGWPRDVHTAWNEGRGQE